LGDSEKAGGSRVASPDGGGVEDLRLRHLGDLIDKGALDQEIFEAIAHGTLYLIGKDPRAAQGIEELRVRCKCDLRVFAGAEELLAAVAERAPSVVLLAGEAGEPGVSGILPELLVASFGVAPMPVVVFSGDSAWLTSFEALTYPQLRLVRVEQGSEGLLDALGQFMTVERTQAALQTDKLLKERIGLSKAEVIQQSLLPESIPTIPGLDIAAYYKPCQEVGGDYYDFIELPDRRLGVVCADVSGKGVGAAMVMVMFRSILRLAADRGGSPRDVVVATNRLIARDMPRGMFVSAAYMVIDPRARRVELVNAGHMPVIHWPARADLPVTVPLGGMVVGVSTSKQFTQTTRQIELTLLPGELLCLYTDGIVEAENPAREQFGEARLLEAFRLVGRVSAQETVRGVMAAVESFCDGAPSRDDTTLIIVKTS